MIKVGNKISVKDDKKVKIGEVIYQNNHFITVQFTNYKESFMKVEIKNKNIEVEVLS